MQNVGNLRPNLIFVMRCSSILLILQCWLFGMMYAASARSQSLKDIYISVDLQHASLKESLVELQRKSNIRISFSTALIDNKTNRINLSEKKINLAQALQRILNGTGLVYREFNDFVIIESKPIQLRVTGKVLDPDGKTPLTGVSVRLKGGQGGTTTDSNGDFAIAVPEGAATLVFTYLGYEAKEVAVSAADRNILVTLNVSTTALGEVIVQARRRANTEIAVLEERRNASIIQDAISADQILKTASITTTQALSRVSGVTITDDKYVAIRGLGDRSVIGQLNGARLASSNPDRSAIPLDLVPASLLDNITIYKTVTPDKPADAAAGIVELKTKSVPDSMTLEVIAQTGFNSTIGIGGEFNGFWNSDMGVWGQKINDKQLPGDFLRLGSQYPGGLPEIQQLIANSGYSATALQEANRINGIMRRFDPVLTTQHQQAPLNQLYSATFGNSYGIGKHRLGVILGGNYYRRTTDVYRGELNQYSIYQGVLTGNTNIYSPRYIPNYITPNSLFVGKYQTYLENTGIETLNYGVLGGLTYRFSPRHEVSAQYMGSWGGETQATNMDGGYEYTGMAGEVSSIVHSLRQTYRTLHTFNFQGEHKWFAGEYSPRLSYNLATSLSDHRDPDYRFVNMASYKPVGGAWYTPPATDADDPFPTPIYTERLYALTSGYVNGFGAYGTIQAEPNGRRWRNLEEQGYNYKADASFPFPLFGERQEFKAGFNYLNRDREFGENMLFLPGSNFYGNGSLPLQLVDGNLDRLVGPDVVGIRLADGQTEEGGIPVGGFLYNTRKSPNNYTGFFETNAYYGMLDLKLPGNIRLAGGVRFERTNIQSAVDTTNVYTDPAVQGQVSFVSPNTAYKTGYKPYYSVNATYTYRDNMNFRMAFNTTLARPELREITNVFEFDAFQMGLVVGNPELVNQHTTNLDFRWEWFPAAGEVIAVSAFGKEIKNQLVKVFSLRTEGLAATYPEFPIIQFQNDPNTGRVWGLELEVVKNLGTLWEPARYFFLGANLLLAQSEIQKTPDRLAASQFIDRHAPETSPLFEQAPFSINAWLNYDNERWGTDLTATFNMVGERLVQINLTGEPDLYTQPAAILDFVFSQRINRRLYFKGYAKNVLDPAFKTVYANPATGGKWYGSEYINRSYRRGAEVMLGFTYNLF